MCLDQKKNVPRTPQEKRRRAAGQRHWEEWVSRKARHCKSGSGNDNNDDDNDEESAAIAREAQEEERRKRDQDEAFAAWAREKDRILRAAKREVGVSRTCHAPVFVAASASCALPNRMFPSFKFQDGDPPSVILRLSFFAFSHVFLFLRLLVLPYCRHTGRQQKRRAMTAGGLNTLEAINKKLRGARCSTPSRYPCHFYWVFRSLPGSNFEAMNSV